MKNSFLRIKIASTISHFHFVVYPIPHSIGREEKGKKVKAIFVIIFEIAKYFVPKILRPKYVSGPKISS